MSENWQRERGTEEILIYRLLNEIRYTKEDIDLDEIMGEIIHIMENKNKITKKSIFDAREILRNTEVKNKRQRR
tara:strand:- start:1855 stop:2076 length:222 start_codon:yes stop_codon:yes gene_type:complete